MKENSLRQSLTVESTTRSRSLYEVVPVETKLEGGFPDIVVIRKEDGAVAVCELKNVVPGDLALKFRKNQPLFLRRWAALCPGVTRALVLARVKSSRVPSGVYLWCALPTYEWVSKINGKLEDVVNESVCFWPEERSMPWNEILKSLFLWKTR